MTLEAITGKILEKYYKPKTQAEEEDFVACGTELITAIDKQWKKKIRKALNKSTTLQKLSILIELDEPSNRPNKK